MLSATLYGIYGIFIVFYDFMVPDGLCNVLSTLFDISGPNQPPVY